MPLTASAEPEAALLMLAAADGCAGGNGRTDSAAKRSPSASNASADTLLCLASAVTYGHDLLMGAMIMSTIVIGKQALHSQTAEHLSL